MLLLCERGGEGAASTNGVSVKQLWLCTPEVAHAYSPPNAPRRTRTGASCIAELSRSTLLDKATKLLEAAHSVKVNGVLVIAEVKLTDMDWSRGKPRGRLLGHPLGCHSVPSLAEHESHSVAT